MDSGKRFLLTLQTLLAALWLSFLHNHQLQCQTSIDYPSIKGTPDSPDRTLRTTPGTGSRSLSQSIQTTAGALSAGRPRPRS